MVRGWYVAGSGRMVGGGFLMGIWVGGLCEVGGFLTGMPEVEMGLEILLCGDCGGGLNVAKAELTNSAKGAAEVGGVGC